MSALVFYVKSCLNGCQLQLVKLEIVLINGS